MRNAITAKKIGWLSLSLALLTLLGSCQGSGKEGPASVHLTLALPNATSGSKAAFAPAPLFIHSFQLEVTGPDISPLSTSAPVNPDGTASLIVQVAAGPARHFVVTAFDSDGVARYRGETTADLAPSTAPDLIISMAALDLPAPPATSIQISPVTAIVPKGTSQPFTLTGIDPLQVEWKVSSPIGNVSDKAGTITPDGKYIPPPTILTDGSASAPFGTPVPVTVTGFDKNAPAVGYPATVRLTTGARLAFDPNRSVIPPSRSVSTESSGGRGIAFYKGHVYVVWSQILDLQQPPKVLFSESADGIKWTDPIAVAAGTVEQKGAVSAVGPDGSLYVAFVECPASCSSNPTPIVRLLVRRPNNPIFTSIPLTLVGGAAQDPAVVVSSEGTVYLAWSADQGSTSFFDILFQRFDRTGAPLDDAPKDLTSANGAFNEMQPVLALGPDDTLFLTWQVSANSTEIAVAASVNRGDTFLPEVRINDTTDPTAAVSHPSIAVAAGQTAYVVWEKDTCGGDGCTAAFYNVVKIAGPVLEFQGEKPVGFAVTGSTQQNNPSVSSDGAGGLYFVFAETLRGQNTNGIFLVKSTDGAANFAPPSQINTAPAETPARPFPSVVVDSAGRLFAIWSHFPTSTQGSIDILFSKGE